MVQKRGARAESFTWKAALNHAWSLGSRGQLCRASPASPQLQRVSRCRAAPPSPSRCAGHRRQRRQRALRWLSPDRRRCFVLQLRSCWAELRGCRWSGYFRPRGAALNCVQERHVCAVGKAVSALELRAAVCFSAAVPRPGCDLVCGAERLLLRWACWSGAGQGLSCMWDKCCVSAAWLFAF